MGNRAEGLRGISFLGISFSRRNKEQVRTRDLQAGDVLTAKNKRQKLLQKLYFMDPKTTFVIEETYTSENGKFCRATKYSSEFPQGHRGEIHVVSFMQKNFELAPKDSTPSI